LQLDRQVQDAYVPDIKRRDMMLCFAAVPDRQLAEYRRWVIRHRIDDRYGNNKMAQKWHILEFRPSDRSGIDLSRGQQPGEGLCNK
jgi:hypothetical protein